MQRRLVADWPLFFTALLLSAYGISIVYSAGETDIRTVAYHIYMKQLVWFAISIVVALGVSRASVRVFEWATTPFYWGVNALLAVTLVIGRGAGTAASQKGWIGLGPAKLQPAELAKLSVVLMLAQVLASRRDAPKSLVELWRPAMIVGIPWLLIMLQPDLGTGIVFGGIFFAMLFWAGVPWPLLVFIASPVVSLVLAAGMKPWGVWFLLLLALVWYYKPLITMMEGIVIVTLNVLTGSLAQKVWDKLQPYQQNRLRVFLDPSVDPRASGYHVIQSQVAIGSGGWFGKGFTQGTQKRLAFLPAQHTDFIFAVVGEELGFIGVTLALTLFLALFLRSVRIATRANDAFGSLVAFGLASSWLVHVTENVGMTLNLMPITGIPLPFFSYGGSFMLASWVSIALLMRISGEGRGHQRTLAV